MSDDSLKGLFSSLMHSISLADIAVVGLTSKKTGNPVTGEEVKLNWSQSLADGSPEKLPNSLLLFRLKYDADVVQKDASVFVHSSEFGVAFKLDDEEAFDSCWANQELHQVFLNQQMTTTVWPVFRQNVLDGMSRLGMKPITLPWLFKEI